MTTSPSTQFDISNIELECFDDKFSELLAQTFKKDQTILQKIKSFF